MKGKGYILGYTLLKIGKEVTIYWHEFWTITWKTILVLLTHFAVVCCSTDFDLLIIPCSIWIAYNATRKGPKWSWDSFSHQILRWSWYIIHMFFGSCRQRSDSPQQWHGPWDQEYFWHESTETC
jgi:hypothetical protein